MFQDLWDTDTALNQGIVQLGLDLSQTRLTPAEQSAVGVALGNRWDLPVHQATWEELVQAGTIDGGEPPVGGRPLPGHPGGGPHGGFPHLHR